MPWLNDALGKVRESGPHGMGPVANQLLDALEIFGHAS